MSWVNISPPTAKDSSQSVVFTGENSAPPPVALSIKLFRSVTKPEVVVSQYISSKLSTGSVS